MCETAVSLGRRESSGLRRRGSAGYQVFCRRGNAVSKIFSCGEFTAQTGDFVLICVVGPGLSIGFVYCGHVAGRLIAVSLAILGSPQG